MLAAIEEWLWGDNTTDDRVGSRQEEEEEEERQRVQAAVRRSMEAADRQRRDAAHGERIDGADVDPEWVEYFLNNVRVDPLLGMISPEISLYEQILSDIHHLYSDKEFGLCQLGKEFHVGAPIPPRKLNILVMGNHLSGKSSFINWFAGEEVLKTGMDNQMSGFTVVTSGKRRASLKGPETIDLFPQLQPLQDYIGVLDHLSSEITESYSETFSVINFIDSPGLVDGDMRYPFDVNEMMIWFGQMADMILVFFDPINQADITRTVDIAETLWYAYDDKMTLCLGRADEAGPITNRSIVYSHMIRELKDRPIFYISRVQFKPIILPTVTNQYTNTPNQIDDICTAMEELINETIQHSLNRLQCHASKIQSKIATLLVADTEARHRNSKKWLNKCLLGVPIFWLLVIWSVVIVGELFEAESLYTWEQFMQSGWKVMILFLIVFLGKRGIDRYHPQEPTLSPKRRQRAIGASEAVKIILSKKDEMYAEYLRQVVENEFGVTSV